MVADALDVGRNLEARRDDAQVVRHGLLLGNQEDAVVLDVNDHVVDVVIFAHDAVGERVVVFEERLQRPLHGRLGPQPHLVDLPLHIRERLDVFLAGLLNFLHQRIPPDRPPQEGAVSEADWGSSRMLKPNKHAERC